MREFLRLCAVGKKKKPPPPCIRQGEWAGKSDSIPFPPFLRLLGNCLKKGLNFFFANRPFSWAYFFLRVDFLFFFSTHLNVLLYTLDAKVKKERPGERERRRRERIVQLPTHQAGREGWKASSSSSPPSRVGKRGSRGRKPTTLCRSFFVCVECVFFPCRRRRLTFADQARAQKRWKRPSQKNMSSQVCPCVMRASFSYESRTNKGKWNNKT